MGLKDSLDGNYKLLWSAISGITITATIVALSFFVGDATALPINIAAVVFGISLGWLLGILCSPYSVEEKERFGGYSKGFGIFISGYAASSANKLIEKLFDPAFIFDIVVGFRLLSFLSMLTVAMVLTFVFRKYG